MVQLYTRRATLSLSNFKRGRKYLKCPECGRLRLKLYCYEDGRDESELLGRCQREANCGYHLKPNEYFKKKGEKYDNSPKIQKMVQLSTYRVPSEICEKFILNYKNSTLFKFLCKTGLDFSETFEKYKVGATKNGSTIFFQFDGLIFRTGKIIKYKADGHREKIGNLPAEWMHNKISFIDREKEELRQCFFGEHLIYSKEKICIVESEKTALICAEIFKDAVWVATGGRTQLQPYKLEKLKGKNVFLFPDSDSVEYWSEKTKEISNCKVIDLSFLNEQNKKGADLADFLLESGTKIQKETYKFIINTI